eukprot:CAMPEP_0206318600 /NCGR_PEP_ID=MMETSP0106_2-20121207/17281_1 /ASSEMBLY_ACC=CAM_ASM_000206 /TAXON_ID=81532 /ORGANISM="Acanthoeca-like sp., Strain 10tr" /LENGTH=41 /DNA_ID= /DNA_START= /DNA_END= /DNA_ORIENTATION=
MCDLNTEPPLLALPKSLGGVTTASREPRRVNSDDAHPAPRG